MAVYRDSLGRPNSQATISTFRDIFANTKYLSLSTVSNCPSKQWPHSNVSSIIADMDADGWDCAASQDGYGDPRINCVHRETQAIIDQLIIDSDNKFIDAERGYIRFGSCPKSGHSVNHRDNTPELGISVFEAEFSGNNYRVLFGSSIVECTYNLVRNRPAYRIYGTVIGTGADGEPVLRVSRHIRL